jgi:para-aminobenzoate synthetase / 4-amino-4-deoxychorismate lyase
VYPVAFLENAAAPTPVWLVGQQPIEVLQADRLEQVVPLLDAVGRAAAEGLYAGGFVAYEAAAAMDPALATRAAGSLPLAWFAIFREMTRQPLAEADDPAGFDVGPWQPSVTQAEYERAIGRIKDYIAAGDTYQANYTYRLRAYFSGDPWQYFLRLNRPRPARHAAFVDTGRHVLCSVSPELFFTLDGTRLVSQPMKGTAPRGYTCDDDAAHRAALAASTKDRAENAMIVDMVRNDLGRVARRGSVEVLSAFDVETHPTVLQMTSRVAAETGATLVDVFRALFPPASITGAPKVRTMQILRELEPEPRGIYTGAIGLVGPGRRARFNVAIRTVAIDRASGAAEYGVGGGIVWDSTPAAEWAECATKAAVLTADTPQFELLETLLFERGEYFLLERHLARLTASAAYFQYAANLDEIRARLRQLAASLPSQPQRVRLRVAHDGHIALAAVPQAESPRPWRLRLATTPIARNNRFLYHKTTARAVYDAAYAQRGAADDVILWNDAGEVTETTIANLVIRCDGRLITPPIACGLLGGVFRAELLAAGEIHEAVITLDDLRRADAIFAINAVRRWLPAVLNT